VFKLAAIFGLEEGHRIAMPVIFERMIVVEVETSEDYAGNVMGDLSSHCGMVDAEADGKTIHIELPNWLK
jgi:elongation factor G